jgi:hypothetical protein
VIGVQEQEEDKKGDVIGKCSDFRWEDRDKQERTCLSLTLLDCTSENSLEHTKNHTQLCKERILSFSVEGHENAFCLPKIEMLLILENL